jgi:hypothetical protein
MMCPGRDTKWFETRTRVVSDLLRALRAGTLQIFMGFSAYGDRLQQSGLARMTLRRVMGEEPATATLRARIIDRAHARRRFGYRRIHSHRSILTLRVHGSPARQQQKAPPRSGAVICYTRRLSGLHQGSAPARRNTPPHGDHYGKINVASSAVTGYDIHHAAITRNDAAVGGERDLRQQKTPPKKADMPAATAPKAASLPKIMRAE